MSGSLKKDAEIYNTKNRESERVGAAFYLRGKEQLEAEEITAGDIGATSKLQFFKTGDTISTKANPITYPGIDFPKPCFFMAISAKAKDADEKVGIGLHRLNEEDHTFSIDRNVETKEQVIGGQGNIQLAVIMNKLKNNFKVEVDLTNPKVAYRETIRGKSDVQGKHKKQSGGAGQYGDVRVRFEPTLNEFEFVDEVFGGAVPRNFIPAVEKGLRECMDKGVLAGCKVVGVKATLYDGSYHDVDSNEMSFKIAASLAFKKGITEAKPVLLAEYLPRIAQAGAQARHRLGACSRRESASALLRRCQPLRAGAGGDRAGFPQSAGSEGGHESGGTQGQIRR
jgi:elongation factor G